MRYLRKWCIPVYRLLSPINSFLKPVLIASNKFKEELFKLLLIVLDKLWHFFRWLSIPVLLVAIIGNYAFAYVTQCTPKSCIGFTNPSGWPIVIYMQYHPLRSQTAIIFLVGLILCALIAHRDRCKFTRKGKRKEIGGVTIVPTIDLLPDRLNLGDDAAANFKYISMPIQDIYDESIRAIERASKIQTRDKRGILVVGESNAGKTRLASEAMKQVLPDWDVLCWLPNCVLKEDWDIESIDTKQLLIFVDDLQNYVESQSSIVANDLLAPLTLRTLLDNVFQDLKNVVVVATCRTEDLSRVEVAFDWLYDKLEVISIPSFSVNSQDPQVRKIIEEFQRQDAENVKEEDWDGTLGSLVLGLSRKKRQYLSLRTSNPFAYTILNAMKILFVLGISLHTEQRIQAICKTLFGKEELQRVDVWREALENLKTLQFIKPIVNNSERTLVIRKDVYFEKVIIDYEHYRIKEDFITLSQIFIDLQDSEALANLGMTLITLKQLIDALNVCNKALDIDPQNVNAAIFKSVVYYLRNQPDKALAVYDQALSFSPNNTSLLENKANLLKVLRRYEKALAVYDQALSFSPNNTSLLENKAKVLVTVQRYEKALAVYDQALSFSPNNTSLLENKAKVLVTVQRYEEALAVCEQIISNDSNRIGTWLKKAALLKEMINYEKALTAYDHVLTLDPDNCEAWLEKGCILGRQHRFKEALTVLERATNLNPKSTHALKDLGRALIGLSRLNEALFAFDKALSLDPRDGEAWDLKSSILSNLGRHEEALVAYNHALSLLPKNAEIWRRKGRTLMDLERTRDALAAFNRGLSLNSEDTDLWLYKGKALEKLGRHKNARLAFDQALALDPEKTDAWFNKGYTLGEMGQHEEARTAFEQVLARYPNHIIAWINKGVALEKDKKYQEALEAFDRALSLDSKNASAWFNKGVVLRDLHQNATALKAFDQSISLDPKNALYWQYKARVLILLRRYRESLKAYRQATTLGPKNVKLWIEMGHVARKLGHDAEALVAFDQATILNPKNSVAWEEKGCLLLWLGQKEEALVALDRALSLSSNNLHALLDKLKALLSLRRLNEAQIVFDHLLPLENRKALKMRDADMLFQILKIATSSTNRLDEINPLMLKALTFGSSSGPIRLLARLTKRVFLKTHIQDFIKSLPLEISNDSNKH